MNSQRPPATRLIFYGWVIGAAILPPLVSLLLHVPRVALDNFTDAVVYLSYARQFGELVSRYGFIYYATRFGGILPDALSGHLFGEINGIWILRWGLSGAVSLTLFLFFRKRYGMAAGIIASLLWSLNPAAMRLLCTTYVDSTAVPFMILGCCLFASGWGGGFGALLAGILLALASSAHLYAAFALLLLTPYSLGALWDNRPVLLKSLCWMVSGFVVTFAAGWLWYWALWGMPAFFSPTLELMRDLGGGQAALWKKPLSLALHETPAWFAPLALLPALIVASIRGNFLIRGSLFSILASVVFFWGGDLFGNAYVLSMPFYYSFLLPVTIFAGATLCGEVLSVQEKTIPQWTIALSLLMEVIVPPLVAASGTLSLWKILLIGILPVLLVACVWRRIQRRILVVLIALGLGFSSGMVAFTGMFSQFLGHYSANDIPVIELAAALKRELPKASQDGEVMRFWYDDTPSKRGGVDRRMIGAFWLHTFGKLTGEKDAYISFPSMSSGDAEAIRYSSLNRIVVFDQDPALVNQAIDEIEMQKLPYRISKVMSLKARSDSKRMLTVAVLEKNHLTQAEVFPVDFKGWSIYHKGRILSQTSDGTDLLSGGFKWWDFAKLPIGSMKKGTSLIISCRVESGMIRFALHEGAGEIIEHVEMWPTKDAQRLILTAPCDLKDAVLTLHSMYPRGSQSQVFIDKVEKAESTVAP